MMMMRRALLTFAAALAATAATLPRQAPDLKVETTDGRGIQISSYKGKPLVVAFILTSCSHCQHTTGILTKLYPEYAPRGLNVVESAIETGAAAFVPRFVQQFRPPFPVGYNTNDAAQSFMEHSPMLLMHMPALAFIDRDGKIVAQYEGDDPDMLGDQEKALRARIEQILKPTTTRAPAATQPAARRARKQALN